MKKAVKSLAAVPSAALGMLSLIWALLFACSASEGPPSEAVAETAPELEQKWARLCEPKPGTEYVNGMPKEIIWLKDGAEMVLVPAGEFLFGEENERREEPAFYIDKFPVTNERYKKFVEATEHRVPFMGEGWAKPYNWRRGTYPEGRAKHPVVLVDWYDVVAYCRWAGKAFPSEQQWEKAARGTDGRRYPWGNEFTDPTRPNTARLNRGLLGAVFRALGVPVEGERCNCWHAGIETTTPVDKYPKAVSPYGCYDMAGNVWEWTSTPRKLGWVSKGGSWFDGEVRVRTTSYGWIRPQLKGNNVGFRCAVILPK